MRWCIYFGLGGILGLALVLGSTAGAKAGPPPGSPVLETPRSICRRCGRTCTSSPCSRIGTTSVVGVLVKNSGAVATTKSCSLRVSWLPSVEQGAISRYQTVPPLKRNESRWLFVNFGNTSLANGFLLGRVDVNNQIAESNEANNFATKKLP